MMTVNKTTAGSSFEQPYALICFSRAKKIRHADALISFSRMAKRYPDVWEHVTASNVTGGAPYKSLLMDAPACALFMTWRRDDPANLCCYAANGPLYVKGGEATPTRFMSENGQQFNAWRSDDATH